MSREEWRVEYRPKGSDIWVVYATPALDAAEAESIERGARAVYPGADVRLRCRTVGGWGEPARQPKALIHWSAKHRPGGGFIAACGADSPGMECRAAEAVSCQACKDALKAPTLDDLAGYLGEGFHTAFRRVGDSPEAHAVWTAIRDMEPTEWRDVLLSVAGPTAEFLGVKLRDE